MERRADTSGRGVAFGLLLALAIPIAYLGAALLIGAGIPVIVRDGSTMNTLTTIAVLELALGPIGLVVVGVSIPLRSVLAWILWLTMGIFVVAFLWFYAVAMLSGALGSPF